MYKLDSLAPYQKDHASVIRLSDGAGIPFDPDNTDYQEYLEWAKTNTAEEAD